MAIYYLKTESLTKNLIVNILLCFSGIILITQPRFLLEMLGLHYKDHEVETQILGVILMLSAAMFSSIIQVLINTLAE
jgi:drug/metabolite transporter (DMT)-like permease